MNLVLIIVDTWRQDHVGAYGNTWIRTPHLDSLARESALFTRCYPESLPTLPVRRALHTGTRTYPFWGHRSLKGDFVGAPGWGPIPEEQDTLSELLRARGYRTALITDTYHQFKPGKNYGRGFDEWQWVRGQENDPWRSGPKVSDEVIFRHLPESQRTPRRVELYRNYLTNVADRNSEEDYFAAQVFREGAKWLFRNQDAEKFFLVLDSFDPHEPWDPPAHYRRMYDPVEDDVIDIIWPWYGQVEGYTQRQVERIRANYAGECTLVDRWLGHFLEALQVSGHWQDTLVAVISDHGTNLGDAGYIGKRPHPMTRGVADLILMIRHPSGELAGTRCDALCYNMDLTPTLLRLLGEEVPPQMKDGLDLWAMAKGEHPGRKHVTVAWGPHVTYIDDHWWCTAVIGGGDALLFDLKEDPHLTRNLAAEHPQVLMHAARQFQEDAGGSYPDYLIEAAGRLGCSPILDPRGR